VFRLHLKLGLKSTHCQRFSNSKSELFSSDFKWSIQTRLLDIRTLSHDMNTRLVRFSNGHCNGQLQYNDRPNSVLICYSIGLFQVVTGIRTPDHTKT
jgi:hypothetical protein